MFFTYAEYIIYYKGALRGVAEKEQEDKKKGRSSFQEDSGTKMTTDQWAMNRAKKPQSTPTDSGESGGEVDAALNPALTAVQPGEKMPFLEKGTPKS